MKTYIFEKMKKLAFMLYLFGILATTFACTHDVVPEIPKAEPSYSIGGAVAKSDGGAASGAAVELQNAASDAAVVNTTVDATGAYIFTGVKSGEYQIVITLEGYETATVSSITVVNANVSGKDAVLQKITEPTYAVGGKIVKYDESAAAGATVKLLKAADNTLAGQAVTADDDGLFSISTISAGDYTLVATLDGFQAGVVSDITVTNADITLPNIVLNAVSANSNEVSIVFSDNGATVSNLPPDGSITASADGADVTIATSSLQYVEYIVSGATTGGSLKIQNNAATANTLHITMDNATIISTSQLPPVQITKNEGIAIIELKGNSILKDDADNEEKAALISKSGAIEFEGYGSLNIVGNAKHAIASNRNIAVRGGEITVAAAASDGFHAETGFDISGGSLKVATVGDAIDSGSGTITVNGGNIDLTVSGQAAKGLNSKKSVEINNGTLTVETSGAAVLEASGSGYDISYCTAVKADENITVGGGAITINCLKAANGGKGLSADGNIIITGGTLNIATAGDGAVYTNVTGVKDSYSSACIKADGNVSLLGGTITCSSTGSAGKAISADGNIVIGETGAGDNAPVITASTTGQKFVVSGSSGGGPGGGGMGGNADYANPKIIKSNGALTVNGGTLRLTGTTDGGEALESKSTLTVNGGYLEINTYDDCLNAAQHLIINGGTVQTRATGNDAIDSNGDIAITGGLVVVQGSEDGIDSDNTAIQISGGTVVGVSGQSMGSRFAGTQKYISVSATANTGIGVKIGDTWALLFVVPTKNSTGGGGGPGGGGGNSQTVIISLPQFVGGTSYTLYTGGTISGGTTSAFGYNVGGTYSGGTSKSGSL